MGVISRAGQSLMAAPSPIREPEMVGCRFSHKQARATAAAVSMSKRNHTMGPQAPMNRIQNVVAPTEPWRNNMTATTASSRSIDKAKTGIHVLKAPER